MSVRSAALVPTLAMLFVVAVTGALGNWQLNRAEQKRELQQERDRAALSKPIAVSSQWLAAEAVDKRQVRVRGRWLAAQSIFIDNRTHEGRAGFHVITPLRLRADDGADTANKQADVVLVLRGWIARDMRDRNVLPALPSDPGLVELTGRAQAHLVQSMQLGQDPVPGEADRLWQFFDLPKYRRWSGLAIQPFIVRQTSLSADGLIRQWRAPGNDVDKHTGYAVQWFAMALAGFVFWVWASFFRRHQD